MDNKTLFYFSGFSSIFIYLFLIVSVAFFLQERHRQKLMVRSEVEVMLQESSFSKVELPKPSQAEEKRSEKKEEEHKKSTVEPKKEETKPAPAKKDTIVDAKKLIQSISSAVKPKEVKTKYNEEALNKLMTERRSEEATKALGFLSLQKNNLQLSVPANTGISNEYLSKVATIIQSGWQPEKSDAGMQATIVIYIKSDGSFDFSMKERSLSQSFNAKLLECLAALQKKGFPQPVRPLSIEFDFKAKE